MAGLSQVKKGENNGFQVSNLNLNLDKLDTKKRAHLDTLAQLSPKKCKPPENRVKEQNDQTRQKFINRQKAKAISVGVLFKLVDLDSPLKKSYWNTYHCNEYLFQHGNKVKTKYCGQRWCSVCSRIMTAKMVNQYGPELRKFKDLQFITLSATNVVGDDLSNEIDRFNTIWRKIYKRLKKKTSGYEVKGLRKIETTLGKDKRFNPHYHLLIEGEDVGKEIIQLWLKYNDTAGPKGQDIRKAKEGALIELFKYTTKQIYDDEIHGVKLDVIYRALKGRRIYAAIGIDKYVSEDIEGIRSNIITFKPHQNKMYVWDVELRNWIARDGEDFMDCSIPEDLKTLLDKHKPKTKIHDRTDVYEIMTRRKEKYVWDENK